MGVTNYILIFTLFSLKLLSQTDSLSNSYYREFNDKISVQLFGLNNSNSFTIDYADENLNIDLIPNQKTTIGISAKYKFIALSFGFAPHFFAENKDNKGSKMFSFNTDFILKRFVQHFYFYYQKGIYGNYSNGFQIYFENLKTTKVGGRTSYIFNKNFSYNALNFQNAQQVKSVGTFAASINYYYTLLDGNSQSNLDGKFSSFNFSVGPTYIYNWNITKKIILAPEIYFGFGASRYKDDEDKDWVSLIEGNLNLTLGYNSDHFYGGLKSKSIAFNYKTDNNVNFGDRITFLNVFLGYRFDAPRFLRNKNI